MSTIDTCCICGGRNLKVREGKIRTKRKIKADKILECLNCSFVFLNENSHIKEDHYKKSLMHPILTTLEELRCESRQDDVRRLRYFIPQIKGKKIIEIGSGNGQFLKFSQRFSTTVCGVEPEARFKDIFLEEKLNIRNDINKVSQKFDSVFCFHVIEHVKDPIEFIESLFSLVESKGTIFVETPNSKDALISLYKLKAFSNFTYWDNHLVLFSKKSFKLMMSKYSYSCKLIKVQRYGLGNHIGWILNGEPGGHKKYLRIENSPFSLLYKKILCFMGRQDTLLFKIMKSY